MKTVVKRMYEGLFLVDSGEAAAGWQAVTGAVERILGRSEADVVSMRKWDERRLAYDIGKKSRGTYILVYFNCDASRLGAIERDVQLSETIMRVMILRTDKMSAEDIARPTPSMVVEIDQAAAAARAAQAAEAAAASEAEGGPVDESQRAAETEDIDHRA